MNTIRSNRSTSGRLIRKTGWLATGAMLAVAAFAPAVQAAGPGNNGLDATGNGTTSNATVGGSLAGAGSSATLSATAKMFCSGTSVGSIDGTLTLSKTLDVGSVITLYMVPNNGSNASPAGNVPLNEISITLTNANNDSGDVISYSLPVTHAFTTSAGGILVVFAVNADHSTAISSSKTNSLNCTEASSPSPSETPSESPSEQPSESPSEQPSESPSEQPSESPSEQPSEQPSASTAPSGEVEGVTGTPRVTPPPTDTIGGNGQNPSNDGWRIALIGLAAVLAGTLTFVNPRRSSRKR